MSKKEKPFSEEDIKLLEEDYGKPFSEHFINFILKQKKFDFNAFKTKEEFDDFKKEKDEFFRKYDN